MKDKEQVYTLTGIHQPPQGMQQGFTNTFSTEFTDFLTEATPQHNNILTTSQHNNILILGDFNIQINDLEDADSCLLLNTTSAFNLTQQVDVLMHIPGQTLDLIILENSEEYQVEKIIPGPYISDHQFLTM